MAEHNELGQAGEQVARKFLEEKEYRIIAQNWSFRNLELDLIADHRGKLVFVEVKTRSGVQFGYPEYFVTRDKRKRLKKAAIAYLERCRHEGEVRFDIVSVVYEKDALKEINHFEDAFF
jgi:putative endonuclease